MTMVTTALPQLPVPINHVSADFIDLASIIELIAAVMMEEAAMIMESAANLCAIKDL